jgi:uncharacterized damage-inducible protein DinB
VNSLKPEDLCNVIKDQNGINMELRQMLLHMVEEEPQHRGELNALLWQMNVEPPIIELQDFLRSPER